MTNLIIIAYGIKSKVFKQLSSVRLHVNWLSVLHNYKHIPVSSRYYHNVEDSELSKRYFHNVYKISNYHIYFYIKDDNILKRLYLFTYFIVLFYIFQWTKKVMVKGWLKVIILFKTDILPKCFAPKMYNWLSRTIPMSKYFSGSRPLRHNEVQLYIIFDT